MTSDTSNNTSGSQCGAACGKGMLCAARWARGRVASGRLLACRTLRRGSPALALAVVLLSGLLGQLAAAGIGMVPVAHAQSSGSGGANVFHPSNDHGGKAVYLPGQVKTVKTVPPAQTT
ncbi:MAG TPA: hypothetical protein VJQ45_11945, partial [Ktedonobacterales bacterium]|nr:hypothetical protein [Ktedonobacterales bacterium]